MSTLIDANTNNAQHPETKPVSPPATMLSVSEIHRLLPHRYPFALVDRIIEYVPQKNGQWASKMSQSMNPIFKDISPENRLCREF